MTCENCTCPVCSEKAEIKRIVAMTDNMGDLPQKVFDYWDRQDAEEALAHPSRLVVDTYVEGRRVQRVTTDFFTEEGSPDVARRDAERALLDAESNN